MAWRLTKVSAIVHWLTYTQVVRAAIDAQSGDVLSHWDEDSGLLWCVGRGDRVMRRFECTSSTIVQGATWRSEQNAATAFCALPHKLRDVMDLEVFKCLRLTASSVDTASFRAVRDRVGIIRHRRHRRDAIDATSTMYA